MISEKKVNSLEEVLKKTFFVDGEVKKIAELKFVLKGKNVKGNVFELTDSKREDFYIIIAK